MLADMPLNSEPSTCDFAKNLCPIYTPAAKTIPQIKLIIVNDAFPTICLITAGSGSPEISQLNERKTHQNPKTSVTDEKRFDRIIQDSEGQRSVHETVLLI